MSETNGTNDSQSQQNQQTEKVGDILHKERVTRRITLETIAKDLKLNVRYIKAIESNDFKDLPSDPYIRVYLRSIANYLMLDPDEILRKFFEDRGIAVTDSPNNKSEKIKIDIKKESRKQPLSWIIIISVIVVLATLSYISNKMGWISTAPVEDTQHVTDTTEQSEIESSDSLDTATNITEDSLTNNEASDSEEESKAIDTVSFVKDSLKLVIKTIKDSVWAQVFYDGVSWKNFIRAGRPRVFYAKDSMNIHVGYNSRLRYTLNGKKLVVNGGGVKIFRLDHNGTEGWKMSKWKSVFKNRL